MAVLTMLDDSVKYGQTTLYEAKMETLLAALLIFVLRIMDMSLDTIRMLFIMRGRKALAGLIGATQAAVFIVAVSAVFGTFRSMLSPLSGTRPVLGRGS